METTEWLEEYLRQYAGAVVMVSHDRFFLDRTADTVCEFRQQKLIRYAGNYTSYKEQKSRDLAIQERSYRHQQEEIERLEELIERFKNKPKKAAFARSRKKILERMPKIEKPPVEDYHMFTGALEPSVRSAKWVLEAEHLQIGYDKTLLELSLRIRRGQKIGIIGPNGGGKTTLIKCILGLLKPTTGEILYHSCPPSPSEIANCQLSTVNCQLSMGYLPQYSSIDRKFPITVEEVILSGLSSKKPLASRFTARHREKASAVIARMGLEGMEQRAIGALSGGQLQRALLGRAIISDPQVVILDEPSTYIDKRFEARLYELLAEINKDCAIILVSHDIGTVLQQVKSIACVNETLDYHPDTGVTEEWLERNFNCPIELLGHGTLPHRILKEHKHSHG